MRDANGPDTATTKPSNPKDLAAFGKRIAFSVIPFRVLAGLALALAEGAYKYGRHNYRPAGVRVCTYVDATLRHLFAYVEGQDIDPASGFHHVDKAMASLAVLRDGLYQGNVEDDRPPRVAGDFIAEANAQYEALAARMAQDFGPTPKAPFTQRELEASVIPNAADAYMVAVDMAETPDEAACAVVDLVDGLSKEERTAAARAALVKPCKWRAGCVNETEEFSGFCAGACEDVDGIPL